MNIAILVTGSFLNATSRQNISLNEVLITLITDSETATGVRHSLHYIIKIYIKCASYLLP